MTNLPLFGSNGSLSFRFYFGPDEQQSLWQLTLCKGWKTGWCSQEGDHPSAGELGFKPPCPQPSILACSAVLEQDTESLPAPRCAVADHYIWPLCRQRWMDILINSVPTSLTSYLFSVLVLTASPTLKPLCVVTSSLYSFCLNKK